MVRMESRDFGVFGALESRQGLTGLPPLVL